MTKRRSTVAIPTALPYPIGPLHTAVETPTYLAATKRAGLTKEECEAVLDQAMTSPASGDLIRGTGGVRKMRVSKEDTGKSGGYRVLTYYMDREAPVFLLFVINKTEADTITDKQAKLLRQVTKAIKDERNTGIAAGVPRRTT